jgi:hypothetical protein
MIFTHVICISRDRVNPFQEYVDLEFEFEVRIRYTFDRCSQVERPRESYLERILAVNTFSFTGCTSSEISHFHRR